MNGFLKIMRGLKKVEIEEYQRRQTLAEAKAACRELPPARDFMRALSCPGISVIAEIKYASPSRGRICSAPAPAEVALAYRQGGAAAISVLTEERYFEGRKAFLKEVRAAVDLPLLRKDFIIDPYQVYESRLAGADALLLIKAMLTTVQLADLIGLAGELGLAALVEIHQSTELQAALAAGARLIGINNRDLDNLSVDIGRAVELAALCREHKGEEALILVAESGYYGHEDIAGLPEQGIDAVLVGEALMRSADKSAAVRELRGGRSG